MPEDTEKEEFELSDVEVETVGLVSAGAIGEDFYLTKKDGGSVPEDNESEVEVLDTEQVSFWDRMETMLKNVFGASREDAVEKTSEEQTIVVEETTTVEEVVMPEVEKTVEQPVTEDIGDVVAKVQKALDEKYSDVIKNLQDRVAKAEAEATRVQDETAEKEMIAKARDLGALPVRYDELGRKLYKLSKAIEKEDFDWLVSVLTAVDKQLGAAGIFSEFGTSKVPEELALEDKVEKIAKEKNVSYDVALLELPEAEQKQLLMQMRK